MYRLFLWLDNIGPKYIKIYLLNLCVLFCVYLLKNILHFRL